MIARDKRRLALLGRQLALARVARREALGSLAGALAEERRSRDLALRSRDLADAYARRKGAGDGGDLAGRMRFAGALSQVAANAETSGAESAREAEGRARAVAEAERRTERLESREAEARRALERALERRADAAAGVLARKVHKSR